MRDPIHAARRCFGSWALASLLFGASLFSPAHADAPTCAEHRVVISFINGVFVTTNGANSESEKLNDAICSSSASASRICQEGTFKSLYSHSGLNDLPRDRATLSAMGASITGGWEDIVEAIWQIAHQSGRADPAWYDYLLFSLMNPGQRRAIMLLAVDLAYSGAHPPTAQDQEAMSAQLESWYGSGFNILLLAHSQGNLFAYPVYETFIQRHGRHYVRAYGIAPPTSKRPGGYILNSLDLVIEAARLTEIAIGTDIVAPPPNATQFCPGDLTGHGLSCYLSDEMGTTVIHHLESLYGDLLMSRAPHFTGRYGPEYARPRRVFVGYVGNWTGQITQPDGVTPLTTNSVAAYLRRMNIGLRYMAIRPDSCAHPVLSDDGLRASCQTGPFSNITIQPAYSCQQPDGDASGMGLATYQLFHVDPAAAPRPEAFDGYICRMPSPCDWPS